MQKAERTYLSAAGRDWLLPLYDPLTRWLGTESIHRDLLDQAGLLPNHRVLDVGCGTGSLAMLITRHHPGVEVVGLDPDPKALALAQRKAERSMVAVQLDRGFSDDLPYRDASFDRVFSSFVLHHLGPDEKVATLREIRRVLRPDGSLHLLDFSREEGEERGVLARILHRSEHLRDNSESRVLELMKQAGFEDARAVSHRSSLFGRASCYRATVGAFA